MIFDTAATEGTTDSASGTFNATVAADVDSNALESSGNDDDNKSDTNTPMIAGCIGIIGIASVAAVLVTKAIKLKRRAEAEAAKARAAESAASVNSVQSVDSCASVASSSPSLPCVDSKGSVVGASLFY